ncbi:hypothetical protein PAXRUDRAFT_835399, partial [Paxillus rubicundulus Ve08.2h10]
ETFAPPFEGRDLSIPLSSIVQISLFGKHLIRNHLLGSYSGRVIDFLINKEKPLVLQDCGYGACATVTMGLSPVVDYQQALNASVDASLARLDNNPRLEQEIDDVDQANPPIEATYSAVETCGQYIVPLGQALQLMKKLVDNVAEAHPLLKLGWTSLSSVYTAVQQQRLDDDNVRGLAESLRELVGVASDCPVAEIKGTPDVIENIERLALEVASIIDEYTKSRFMSRLVEAQMTDVTTRITKCQAELKDLHEKLRTRIMAYIANRAKETQEDRKRKDAQGITGEMRKWLEASDPSISHKLVRDTFVEGTGSWFIKDERFRKWLHERGTKLWISGRPGFGKTVLFSTSVEDVRRHASAQGPTCRYAYFYFDGRESDGSLCELETLLRSLLDQLCFNQAIPDAMKRLYGVDSEQHPKPTLAQLRSTLAEVVQGFDEVYIMIDALDECDSQGELLDWMTSLQSTTQGLHILATSRPERIIEEHMSKSSHVLISLGSELLDNDIKTYVDARVEASDNLRLLMTEQIKERLREKDGGMFRLVVFWIDALENCLSVKAVRDKLGHLPTSLSDMYALLVSKIAADDLQYAQVIIPWLLFAVRRLTLEEMAAAAACFSSSDGVPAFDRDRGFANPKVVLDVCGGLVVMSKDGVTLAHLTVKEFLLEQQSPLHVNEPGAHSLIAQSCLSYLLDKFAPRVAPGLGDFLLHDYAVENWMKHASSTREIEDTNSAIYKLALEVLHPEHETFRLLSSAWDTVGRHSSDRNIFTTPLFVCTRWGFQNLTARLLALGVGAATRSESGATALHGACRHGHLEVVKCLLDGPNIVTDPDVGMAYKQANAIELVDINVTDAYSGTPLCSACEGGHIEIVKLLLQNAADVNAQGSHSSTPLRSACYRGDIEV